MEPSIDSPVAGRASRRRIRVEGVVQGVGFRPFVYRIATRFHVAGWVLNSVDGVVIEAEAADETLDRFISAIGSELPPLARIDKLTVSPAEPNGEDRFTIRQSAAAQAADHFTLVPSDIATCADCFHDFTDPRNRRYAYPFTNCTNCGPRYTIIRDVPYDRPKTTMASFTMCAACQAEYDDPADRRFHAEPNACPACGPGLALLSAAEMERAAANVGAIAFARGAENARVLEQVRALLAAGSILAIKGLGGFHLACDATNDRAVATLRERKRRSGKAFAIMTRDLDAAARLCAISQADRDLLESPRRPIVLLARREDAQAVQEDARVATEVAPGNTRLGVMLPYTPLHHLLFENAGFSALVMTSGNMSEEPIVSRNQDAWPRLRGLADHFLLHDREIQTRVDDSVIQSFAGREYPVRRSRGFAPDPVDLSALAEQNAMPVREILACGGELKNTLCLLKDHYAILSQHIGDLENIETLTFFRETLAHLKRFFRVAPVAVACDLHPNYLSTRFALEESGLPAIGVQHHHAHIASCMADNGISGRVIGVALDGTGFGTDGRIWGGEFLVCDYADFERRAHLAYMPLAGGDSGVREPWRSAVAYLDGAFGSAKAPLDLPLFAEISRKKIDFLRAMVAKNVQVIQTSSCGRLFDAVSSILGIRHETSYEGQAAIELEAAADAGAAVDCEVYPFDFSPGNPMQIDMRATIRALVRDFLRGDPVSVISARFHATVGRVIVECCARIRETDSLDRVCLSGGTFQNLLLLDQASRGLAERGFQVFIHHRVPANDGGLALGQAVIANRRLRDLG